VDVSVIVLCKLDLKFNVYTHMRVKICVTS